MKRKLKLKKKIKIIILFLILAPIIIYICFPHKKTNLELLKEKYEENEVAYIEENYKDNYDYFLNNDIDLKSFLPCSKFITNNLERYVSYSRKENLDSCISVIYVNLKLDYNFYTNVDNIFKEDDYLVLVNKYNTLSKEYEPNDLVTFGNNRTIRKVVKDAYDNLYKDAYKENIRLYSSSGYRSYETQEKLYNERVLEKGPIEADKYAAKPGYSEHQTGLAIDLVGKDDKLVKADSDEYKWLKNNAYKYGFIIRYQENKSHITGFSDEPWHIRYVGIEVATYIYENNITFEEYYELNIK